MRPKGVLEEKLMVLPTGYAGGAEVSIGRTGRTFELTFILV
jgi:hypothetical protein